MEMLDERLRGDDVVVQTPRMVGTLLAIARAKGLIEQAYDGATQFRLASTEVRELTGTDGPSVPSAPRLDGRSTPEGSDRGHPVLHISGAEVTDAETEAEARPELGLVKLRSIEELCGTGEAREIRGRFVAATKDRHVGANEYVRHATYAAIMDWRCSHHGEAAPFGQWSVDIRKMAKQHWETVREQHGLDPIADDHFQIGVECTLNLARITEAVLQPDGTPLSSGKLFADHEEVATVVDDVAIQCDAELIRCWLSGELVRITPMDYGLLARLLYPLHVADRKASVAAALKHLVKKGLATIDEKETYLVID
jgi:hypothetical protein